MRRQPAAAGELYLPPGERDEVIAKVEHCDREVETARANGDQRQLLAALEQSLFQRRRLYAESSPEVAVVCQQLCEVCNSAATQFLQQGNMQSAHDLLKRAEQVADKSDMDRAITWNNLACYYRRTGKLRIAAALLERALVIEEYVRDADAAQTHLNLCATLSQLQRHADALYHAQSALIRVYENMAPTMMAGKLSSGGGQVEEEAREQVTVLCIAYHNLAVEHEYLKNFEAAICAYAEGARWAMRFLDPGHQLVAILRDSVGALKAKVAPQSGALRRANELLAGPLAGGGTATPQPARAAEPGSAPAPPLPPLEGMGSGGDAQRSARDGSRLPPAMTTTPRAAGAEGAAPVEASPEEEAEVQAVLAGAGNLAGGEAPIPASDASNAPS